MRARADARGCVELRGPTWWLRRHEVVVDSVTGATRRAQPRVKLGSKSEIRTRAAARAAADAWIERTRADVVVPGPQVLAVAYFERFIRLQLPLMRPTSRAVYRSIIRSHLVPAAKGLRLVEVDTAWFARFIAERADRMAWATLANLRRVALQILRQAVRDGFGACRIAAADVRLPRQGAAKKTQRYFTEPELQEIIAESFDPWRTLWAVMGYAGLRAGEALALEHDDVDLDRRRITVRQNAVRGSLGAPKTKSSQAEVPIIAPLEEILREYLTSESAAGQVSGLVFPSRAGTPYQADDVRRRQLYPVLAALGYPRAGLHAFRHSLPRLLAARGVTAAVIKTVMRHSSIAQTETYLHTSVEDVITNLTAKGLFEHLQTSADVPPGSTPASRETEISGVPA